jgi:hypothetical protein
MACSQEKWPKLLQNSLKHQSSRKRDFTCRRQGMASYIFQYMPTSLSVKFPVCLYAYTPIFFPLVTITFCSALNDNLRHACIFFTNRHLDLPRPTSTCGMEMFQDRTILEASCACNGLNEWTDVSASFILNERHARKSPLISNTSFNQSHTQPSSSHDHSIQNVRVG